MTITTSEGEATARRRGGRPRRPPTASAEDVDLDCGHATAAEQRGAIGDRHMFAVHTKSTCTERVYPPGAAVAAATAR